MKTQTYPEELNIFESEYFNIIKRFDEGHTFKEDYNDAVKYAQEVNGAVYTMIDGENGKTVYLKGFHLINRFGFCVFAYDSFNNNQNMKGGIKL